MNPDSPHRIEGARYAGIVTKNDQLLLIHRIKRINEDDQEYYVLPGGHREQGETAQQTVAREVAEETSIRVKATELAFDRYNDQFHQQDVYYFCDWLSGDQPELVGEEKLKNSPSNSYRPLWVALSEVKNLNILPPHAKDYLLQQLIDTNQHF